MPGRSRVLRVAGFVVGGLVVIAAAALAAGEVAWRRATARRIERLDARAQRASTRAAPPMRRADLASLPAPVARYLAFALREGQPRIRSARIRWSGSMRLQPGGPWSEFTAEQHFTVDPPGFVWDARFRMVPLVPVLVRDSYVAGTGQMIGRVGGVASVVDEGGTPEMAQSALARWLGEAAWFPTAFLPGDGITWQAIDDTTARATATDGALSVSGEFHFAASGEMTGMSAMRFRDVNGRAVLTRFEGHYRGFERLGGVMIPARADVEWVLPDGVYSYWRGAPTEVRYAR